MNISNYLAAGARALVYLTLMFAVPSCPDGPATAPGVCDVGAVDCPCGSANECNTLSDGTQPLCIEGTCRSCSAGEEGCVCQSGNRCGPDLLCGAAGICQKPSCVLGSEDCGCFGDGTCQETALHCNSDGLCSRQLDGCAPGELDCRCDDVGDCSAGLVCYDDRVCIDGTGYASGPCFPDGGCYNGNRCEMDRCRPCKGGAQGCDCTAEGTCNAGLECVAGACIATTGFAIGKPTDATCSVPCNAPYNQGGVFKACEGGLMEGCLVGQVCRHGQCLPEGSPRTQCVLDTDCPDFQTCLSGFCIPNCHDDTDCVTGAICHQRVCRPTCDVASDTCPPDHKCRLVDGAAGVCTMTTVGEAGVSNDGVPSSSFHLGAAAISVTSHVPSESITLTNTSEVDAVFRVSKSLHRVVNAEGTPVSYTLGSTVAQGGSTLAAAATCVPGTLGCGCVTPPADGLCGALSNGVQLQCDKAGAAPTCRRPTCEEGQVGCVCLDDDCRQYCQGTECPMWWTKIAVEGPSGPLVAATDAMIAEFSLGAGEQAVITLSDNDKTSDSWWNGTVTVTNTLDHQATDVVVTYTQRPDGAWSGEIYYFGDFRLSESGLKTWIDGGHDKADAAGIQNAFLRVWANFRAGQFDYQEFAAVMTATRTESWQSPQIVADCPAGAICYPFPNTDGYKLYTLDPNSEPVPSGLVELPIQLNARHLGGNQFQGKVVSAGTLHYPGDPVLTLEFDEDPKTCSNASDLGCLVFIDQFHFESVVGARYAPTAGCDPRFEEKAIPWLVPGFLGNAKLSEQTGAYQTSECRDKEAPTLDAITNASLASANPIADGKVRRRTVSLVDGALVNNDTLIVLFKETTEAWVEGGEDIVSHGYMVLRKQERAVEPAEFVGSPAPQDTQVVTAPMTCAPDLLAKVGLSSVAENPVALVNTLMSGVEALPVNALLDSDDSEKVHYLCVETGHFDGGSAGIIPCPAGSPVRFFTLLEEVATTSQVKQLPCQSEGTCGDTLTAWREQGVLAQDDPYWRCADPTLAYCSGNRYDLRSEKLFYKLTPAQKVFQQIGPAVDDAFRYRTRFQSRTGGEIGFVPELCIEGSDAIPYCYDAVAIESLQMRVDCLLHTYVEHGTSILNSDPNTYSNLKAYLEENFAFDSELDPELNITVYHSGFEKLQSELLIMLGDDAYTNALSSRFDLAGLSVAAFQGSLFEPDGINLSGVAGAEMSNLYLAAQYYRMALDRFFKLLPELNKTLAGGTSQQILGQATVESYLGRLIRASTQKARVWSEAAKRYQNFNRSDLARGVIERAYVEAYLESVILTHLMQNIVDVSAPEDVDQIVRSIRTAQLSYRVALNDMGEQYEALGQSVDYFGFPPDYMPFPAVEAQIARDNGFEVSANRAWQRVQLALQAEEGAINTTRSFDTDSASFQNELTRLENSFENQLVDICGSFHANGKVYPAIRKYAYLTPETRAVGDPCGLVGNGQIHETMGEIDIALTRLTVARTQLSNTVSEIVIEEDRIDDVCDAKDSWEKALLETRGKANTIQSEIEATQTGLATLDRLIQSEATTAQLLGCSLIFGVASGGDCPNKLVQAAKYKVAFTLNEVAQVAGAASINEAQERIRDLELEEAKISYDLCTNEGTSLMQIDSAAKIKSLLLQIRVQELGALEAQYQTQQVNARLRQAFNRAKRLESELSEMTQLTINVEAAKNDPNFRIYRNDAVVNADVTFFAALREVYKATLVYEYYTSQSYADREKLYLIRMVNRGDYNLQNYLIELEDNFRLFEDQFGVPDARVEVISMRDDVLRVPRLTSEGRPLTQNERFVVFRERLTNGSLLDPNGHIVAPFSIGPDDVSPLTRNHKIRHLEAEMEGSGIGPSLARVYVRMAGTSSVQPLEQGPTNFVTFPERTAVINAFKNAKKLDFYDPEVYKNRRFTDRPLMNSRWEVVFNLKNEPANDDLGIDHLTDIIIYFYYSDFTAF